MKDKNNYQILIDMALSEDLDVAGDITSQAIVGNRSCSAFLICKEDGILAGNHVFQAVFNSVDPDVSIQSLHKDGDSISRGEKIAVVNGKTKSILKAERTAINFISFLSGIATTTRSFVNIAKANGDCQILDTRKTLPGYRALSKYAVMVGGGKNHRQGLYDMILIKDNHIDMVGSIKKAVESARQKWGAKYKVEVECRSSKEVGEALEADVDIIMLDNMEMEEIERSIALIDKRVTLEVSGNMNQEKVGRISACAVDYISIGMITHSIKSLDFSLLLEI